MSENYEAEMLGKLRAFVEQAANDTTLSEGGGAKFLWADEQRTVPHSRLSASQLPQAGAPHMNKELARRVEAAAIEMACGGTLSPRLAWAELDEHSRNLALVDARSYLAAAFPDLFTDPPQAWIAPWEATEAMIDKGGDALSDCVDSGWDSSPDGESYSSYETIRSGSQTTIWNAMRDAYLTTGGPIMRGETDE